MVGPCFALQYFVSFQVLQLSLFGRERAGCFLMLCFWVWGPFCQFLTLPHGAIGWSVVCECGISWLYSITFLWLD